MTLNSNYQYIGRSNGVFNFGGAYQYYLLLYAKTSGSTATGKHTVSVKMRLACQIGVHFYGYNTTGYAKVAGQSAISWTAQPKPNAEWNQNLTEGGVTYPRWIDLQDGSTDVNVGYGVTKDVTLDASFQRLDMAAPPDFVPQTTPMTISIKVTLPAITGASVPTLSVSSVFMESPVVIKTNRKSTALTHKLTYAFGNASGTIAEGVTDSYEWTPSLELARQITNTTTGYGTIYCETYSGSTKVGDTQSVPITLKVPDNASTKPNVSMALSPVSSLASPFNGMYIQNLTKLDAVLSANGQYGASISAYETLVGGSKYSAGYLTQTGDVAVTGKATDSRGLVGTAEQTISVIPYAKPAIVPAEGQTDIVCARCDESGNFTDSGTYLRIIAKRSYSPVEQNNLCQIRYRVNGGSWVTILEGSAAGDEVDKVISGVVTSTTASYSIDIGVVDTLGNDASVTKIVPTDQVDFNLRKGGKGAAFGEYAEEENVFSVAGSLTSKFKGPAHFHGDMYRIAEGGEQEWLHPPMELGVEYRTAERFKGKPVYVKLLEMDTMPNAAFGYMPFATAASTEVVSLSANAIRISDGFTRSLPFFDNSGTCNAVIGVNTQSGQLEVKTLYDFSSFRCTAVVRYIKT